MLMSDALKLFEKPEAKEIYMIAGWHQWADAGSVSSGLPPYLVEQTQAKKIGHIEPQGFYLFQIPGTHHLLRPEIKLKEGHRQALSDPKNEFFYSGDAERGLIIFLGEEPHLDADRYAAAFFDAVEALGVRRVAALGGVYGMLPYDKDRMVTSAFSLTLLKEELARYAVTFSDYEGGVSIGTYLVDQAEERGLEYFTFYAFVPAYDFSQLSLFTQGMRIDNDYKAWYDLMRRFNYMFKTTIDLSDLASKSESLLMSLDVKMAQMEEKVPDLKVREFLDKLNESFTENAFEPLSDVWEQELGDLFDTLDE